MTTINLKVGQRFHICWESCELFTNNANAYDPIVVEAVGMDWVVVRDVQGVSHAATFKTPDEIRQFMSCVEPVEGEGVPLDLDETEDPVNLPTLQRRLERLNLHLETTKKQGPLSEHGKWTEGYLQGQIRIVEDWIDSFSIDVDNSVSNG